MARSKKDELGLPLQVSTAVIAALMGVSERRINQLVEDGRIPPDCRAGTGLWHTSLTLKQIFSFFRRQQDNRKKKSSSVEEESDLESLRNLKLKNAKLANELLPWGVFAQTIGALLARQKDLLLDFGAKMGPQAFTAKDKVEAAQLLDTEVESILKVLHADVVKIADKIRDDEFDDDTEPAPGERPEGSAPAEEHADLEPEHADAVPAVASGVPQATAKA